MKEVLERLTISEFSKISGLSRKTLIFYDNVNLFSPEFIADNNYRYYSARQIDTAFLIQTLKELGMPLKEIKTFLNMRTPEKAENILKNQQFILKQKIAMLKSTEKMISARLIHIHEGIHCKTDEVQLVDIKSSPIIIGKKISKQIDELSSENWADFYNLYIEKKISPAYPIGCILSLKNFKNGNFRNIKTFFLRYSNSDIANGEIRKGKYLIAYGKSNYRLNNVEVFERIYSYITKNDLKLCSDVYYEYILDEVTTKDSSSYLIKLSVQVE